MSLQFMFAYPQRGAEGDMLDAGALGAVARQAEACGWHGFALTDHPAPGVRWLENGGHQSLDPFVALGHVAGVTERLKLHTHLAVAPYRNPLLLAKSAATVDRLSNGRLILGLGVGYLRREFAALGIDFEQRNTLMDEVLDVLPLHWRGEPFSYTGKNFTARDIVALPRPTQKQIPLWIGGNSRKSLQRVADHGAGWIPLMGPRALSSVVRTPVIETLDELEEKIQELKLLWGERRVPPDILIPLPALWQDGKSDIPLIKERLSQAEAIGVSWVFVPGLGNNANASQVSRYLEDIGRDLIA